MWLVGVVSLVLLLLIPETGRPDRIGSQPWIGPAGCSSLGPPARCRGGSDGLACSSGRSLALGLLSPASSVIASISNIGFFVFMLTMGIALLRRRLQPDEATQASAQVPS
jgi:hypothetical protein